MTDSVLFSDLALAPAILTALGNVGYEQPTPVQAACIPLLLEGNDLLATAQTGTGKTAAFALPLLSKLDIKIKSPQVLVLAPTRELAIQVAEAFASYSQHLKGLKVLPVYGGQGMGDQLSKLRQGAHVIVGTPGRVMDHLRRKTLKLDHLQTVVLDEADEMLRMGFIDDVEWILEQTPKQRQIALFSATMPAPIRKIADKYLTKPQRVEIASETRTVEAIEQLYWSVKGASKFDALSRILDIEDYDGVVIFVRTKTLTVEIADKLEHCGMRASPINGDMTQQLRERTIEKLKQGSIDILVATDVAARGIDVPRVSHVFNYDMPFDADVYVHRIGRTGRAGRSGKAILFVTNRENRLLKTVEKHIRQPITRIDLPSREIVVQKRVDRFKESIKLQMSKPVDPIFKRLIQDVIEESNVDPVHLAQALADLAQQHSPLQMKPSKPTQQRGDSDRKSRGGESRGGRDKERGKNKREDRGQSRRESSKKSIVDEFGETVESETYKIAVGHNHEVTPGDIVGAIANEADISSQYIGYIKINDDSSLIDLPKGMPKEVFDHLKTVRVRQHALKIERIDSSQSKRSKPSGDKRKKPTKQHAEKSKSSENDKPRRQTKSKAAKPKATTPKATAPKTIKPERKVTKA